MKLQHQIKQVMKLKDYIDYVVCDGKQVASEEMLSTKVEGLFQTDDLLQRSECAIISERIRNVVNNISNEFRESLNSLELDKREMDIRRATRDLAVDAYALIQARTCLNVVANTTCNLLKNNEINEYETAKIQAVTAMVDSVCNDSEDKRVGMYTDMLLVGAKITQGELVENHSITLLKATSPEQLNEVFENVLNELEININFLNRTKTN